MWVLLKSERILFNVGESQLSGILEEPNSKTSSVVLVLHPHPQYGGDMHNPVIVTLVNALLEVGYATFRFNFRRGGISEALDDTISAAEILTHQGWNLAGIAGYSFGGSTALRYSSIKEIGFVISVSSSLDLYQEGGIDASCLSGIECPVLMFHGKSDLTVPFDNMTEIASYIRSKVECISLETEGHFYHSSHKRVHNEVKLFLGKM